MTNWHIKITKNNKRILDRGTHNYKRLAQYLQAGKGLDCTFELSADYGKHLDNLGELTTFKNEGEYHDYKTASLAAVAFQEVVKL